MNETTLYQIYDKGVQIVKDFHNKTIQDLVFSDYLKYNLWREQLSQYLQRVLVNFSKSSEIDDLFNRFENSKNNYSLLLDILDIIKSVKETHEKLVEKIKFYSSIYKVFGMNLTQMKWRDDLVDKNTCEYQNGYLVQVNRAFKEPIDSNWVKYKSEEQTLDDLLSFDWFGTCGIGVVLGYNKYRAIDVDGVFDYGMGYDDLIDQFLSAMGLPNDYPWVVKSGSGNGFHIIFKCNDINDEIDSISFSPNNHYARYGEYLFQRVELRWCDHLVLPPSYHYSGNQYKFRNEIPKSEPNEVRLNNVDALLTYFCGERQYQNFTYKEQSFYLTSISKIFSRHDSYLSPHDHKDDSIAWLETINDDESLNSLAIRYLLGQDINADTTTAFNLFKQSETQSSYFNLLNLYAIGLFSCEESEFSVLYGKLDQKEFHPDIISDLEQKIKANHNINQRRILFFDTETTGVPKDRNAPETHLDNWPRLVQISWILTNEYGAVLSEGDYVIKPEGFMIPADATRVHGISNEEANNVGNILDDVIKEFITDAETADLIVGHNIDFDIKVVKAEIIRTGRQNTYLNAPAICTMKKTVNYCQIPDTNGSGYKYPKLQELYYKLFNKHFDNSHNSLADVTATKDCFFELLKRDIIKMPKFDNENND